METLSSVLPHNIALFTDDEIAAATATQGDRPNFSDAIPNLHILRSSRCWQARNRLRLGEDAIMQIRCGLHPLLEKHNWFLHAPDAGRAPRNGDIKGSIAREFPPNELRSSPDSWEHKDAFWKHTLVSSRFIVSKMLKISRFCNISRTSKS